MPLTDQEQQQLQQVLGALEAGLTGSDAMSMIDQIESSMQARMAAQREAKGSLLGAIGTTGLEAAQSGMSENDLAAVVESMQAQAGLKTGEPFEERISGVLAPLYGREEGTPFDEGGFPTQGFLEQTQGMPGGLSPLANIGFDESDVSAINMQVRALKAQGLSLEEIRQQIYGALTAGPPDPITGQPTVDEAGSEFVSEFGGLIDQAVRNSYLASQGAYEVAPPGLREVGAPGTLNATEGPTGPTGPTGPSPSSDFNAAGVALTGTGIGAGAALAQGLRGGAAQYGGGGTGALRAIAHAIPRVGTRVPSPIGMPGVGQLQPPVSSGGGGVGFLRALGGGGGFSGIFPSFLPAEMVPPWMLEEERTLA